MCLRGAVVNGKCMRVLYCEATTGYTFIFFTKRRNGDDESCTTNTFAEMHP